MKREAKGRALFYTRDSEARYEMTPGEYVAWASKNAAQLGLSFDGTPDGIEQMIVGGHSVHGDLFLDYGVSGNLLSRPGLDALIKAALGDKAVTHILIPRRDRLARPDDPMDGVNGEPAPQGRHDPGFHGSDLVAPVQEGPSRYR